MIIDIDFKDRFMSLNGKYGSSEISFEEYKEGLSNIVSDVEKYRTHKLRKEKLENIKNIRTL